MSVNLDKHIKSQFLGSGSTVEYVPGITKDPSKRGIFGWGDETAEIDPRKHHSHKVSSQGPRT